MNLKLALEKNIDELENLKELVGDNWRAPRDTVPTNIIIIMSIKLIVS